MRFVNISLDPQGIYIGVTRNGSLFVWSPKIEQWLLYLEGEGKNDEPSSHN